MSSPPLFTEHPLLVLIRRIPKVFTGIEKVLVFYFDSRSGMTESACITSGRNNEIEVTEAGEFSNDILKMRAQSKQTLWYSREELGFEVVEKGARQLKLESEENKNVLKLCFESRDDGKSDLVFIFFTSLLNILPMLAGKKRLDAGDKSIIQHMCERMLAADLEREYEIRTQFETWSRTARHVMTEAGEARRKHNQSRERYSNSILAFCEKILHLAEKKYGNRYRFEFDQDAVQSIKSFNGRLDDLERTINEACSYLVSLYGGGGSKQLIRISDFVLQFEEVNEKKSSELNRSGFNKEDSDAFAAEIYTLNRYEEATALLISKGKKVTLNNVGELCKPPCTGAAISYAIGENIANFRKLFEKYPDNWNLIKENLGPLNSRLTITPFKEPKTKQSNA